MGIHYTRLDHAAREDALLRVQREHPKVTEFYFVKDRLRSGAYLFPWYHPLAWARPMGFFRQWEYNARVREAQSQFRRLCYGEKEAEAKKELLRTPTRVIVHNQDDCNMEDVVYVQESRVTETGVLNHWSHTRTIRETFLPREQWYGDQRPLIGCAYSLLPSRADGLEYWVSYIEGKDVDGKPICPELETTREVAEMMVPPRCC